MNFEEIIKAIEVKPYYQDDAVVIYHADCRDILPLIPDKSIDLVLTDPPYGVGISYGEYVDTQANLVDLIDGFLNQVRRIGKTVLITCGVLNQWHYEPPAWVLGWFIPTTNSGSSAWGFSCWQPILAYGADPYLASNRGRQRDVIAVMATHKKNLPHPTPKPSEVWEMLLLRGSVFTGDIILDPFLGSGTTAYCAKKLGRKCIGVEIEERYCQIAVRRLQQAVLPFEVEQVKQGKGDNQPFMFPAVTSPTKGNKVRSLRINGDDD